MNIIPIINENDPVSTTDIELDDNYPLALKVARIALADFIVIKLNTNGKFLILPKSVSKAIMAEDEHQLFEKIDDLTKMPVTEKTLNEDFPVSVDAIDY
jgi:glutamate 5-kinase